MNARSYYRWLFDLAHQHRGVGLQPVYTPGHSDTVDLPVALNGFADHYATQAQVQKDRLPVAPVPSFAMDEYTFWTALDGWVESSMRHFYSHHRARQQGLSLAVGRGGRMALSLYASPNCTPVPGNCQLRALSRTATVQYSAYRPCADTAASLSRTIITFSSSVLYAAFRRESAAELARRIRRKLVPPVTDEQAARNIAAAETFYGDSALWPTAHAMYYPGLTPKLAQLVPRDAFTSNTSLPHESRCVRN